MTLEIQVLVWDRHTKNIFFTSNIFIYMNVVRTLLSKATDCLTKQRHLEH
jgi:hypothetical protein